MPNTHITRRQESTSLTTSSPNLVVVGPPLNQKHPTTHFIVSFSPFISQFLQIIQKPILLTPSNSSILGSLPVHFPDLRSQLLVHTGRITVLMVFWWDTFRVESFSILIFVLCSILLHETGPPEPCYQPDGSLDHSRTLKSEQKAPHFRNLWNLSGRSIFLK